MHLTALAKRFAETELFSVKDATDVSAWQHHMQHATEQLPLRVLLAYAHTHVVFNQEPLLQAFIDRKPFLFKHHGSTGKCYRALFKNTKPQAKYGDPQTTGVSL